MKVSKLPGRFQLPEYDVPEDLKAALKNDLLAKTSLFSKNDNVELLRWVVLNSKIPPSSIIESYKVLLYAELHHENEEIQKQTLYNQVPTFFPQEKKFKIVVPELNEDDPFVSGGDFVCLHDTVSGMKYSLFIVNISNGYLDAEPAGQKKSVEWFLKDRKYDITFELSHYSSRSAHYAIEEMEKWTFKEDILNPSVRNLKSPEIKYSTRCVSTKIQNNVEQMKAVHDIINKVALPYPYILFGPPGTGKTATIVEAILQIYQLDATNKVLVCTPANTPADDITKLLQRNIPSEKILRLCSVSRESNLEDKDIVKSSNVYSGGDNEDKRRIISRDEIVKKRIIICTLTSSVKLSALRLSSSYFSHIFIDEAAQATEPETWIPISLLMVNESRTTTQVVLSGDPMQLGPVIKSKLVENLLGISMMERLMSLNCYKVSEKRFYTTKLVKNFRCHSSILKVPNELFYDGELQCCGGSEILQGVNWKYLPNKTFPIIFHAVYGKEEKSEDPSPFNNKEISVCLEYVNKLKEGHKFEEKNIGIITPFKKQEIFIKGRMKQRGISKIDVGTVQTFQGLEKDVIIISTVRSRLLKHDGKKHIGFLSNKKRFNVSITRAKALLIVVGNPKILQHDETWYRFIKHCMDNNACKGEKFVLRKLHTITSKVTVKPAKKELKLNSQKIVKPVMNVPPRVSVITVAKEERSPILKSPINYPAECQCDECEYERRYSYYRYSSPDIYRSYRKPSDESSGFSYFKMFGILLCGVIIYHMFKKS